MHEADRQDAEYLEALKRELYRDVVTGFITTDQVQPILNGAEEYRRLRRQAGERLRVVRDRLRTTGAAWRRTWRRKRLKTNGKTISVEQIIRDLAERQYVCDETIADAIYLSLLLQKPLLVEGEPGVGKTEIAKVLADVLGTELIRLQCYEGLDETKALYEWNYQKQLLFIQGEKRNASDVFSRDFLMERPLLRAILAEERAPVLLIDEIDKADEEFEAFLLELLSDFQVSIPEFGTVKARTIPHIVITNNDTREISHAVKRRCIYLYIDYPTVEKEQEILLRKVPGLSAAVARRVAELMHVLRTRADLVKNPSIAEGIDFARALALEGITRLDGPTIDRFLPTIIKNREDAAGLRKRGGGQWLCETS
ncbi:MAG: MoxR family ATPase [Syntrophomonadaceae bacterium]|jgi:MoxR-like ATPase|nr:MoxR family ATPase [Syntrophomonadaceae bacterium]MDH7498209.1 MoxR family ATPase [Syntrophomonadaceae bacterium]